MTAPVEALFFCKVDLSDRKVEQNLMSPHLDTLCLSKSKKRRESIAI